MTFMEVLLRLIATIFLIGVAWFVLMFVVVTIVIGIEEIKKAIKGGKKK